MLRRSFGLAAVLCTLVAAPSCGSDESVAPAPQSSGEEAGADAATQPDGGEEASAESGGHDAPTSATFTLEKSFTVTSVTSGHLAFPDVTRLSDGRLLLVYRQGASHVDKTGRIMKQFGTADGLTWTDPEVLYDAPNIDDRDPSVAMLSNGDVLVTYFQYRQLPLADGTLAVHHCFAGRSHDDGATFGTFVQVDPGDMNPTDAVLDASGHWVDGSGNPIIVQGCSSAVVEWQGKVVLPTYGGQSLNLANLAGSAKSRISRYESTDWGDTWTGGVVAADKATDHWLEEPALVVVDDGSVLMQVRTALGASPSNAGKMMQMHWDSVAGDWSDVTYLPFVGHAPELVQLSDGVVLSGFRELDDAMTREWVSFVYSLDRGATWSDPIRVKDCAAVECGYPAIEDLGAGRFLFVYYAPGGVAIDAAIFRVELS